MVELFEIGLVNFFGDLGVIVGIVGKVIEVVGIIGIEFVLVFFGGD